MITTSGTTSSALRERLKSLKVLPEREIQIFFRASNSRHPTEWVSRWGWPGQLGEVVEMQRMAESF